MSNGYIQIDTKYLWHKQKWRDYFRNTDILEDSARDKGGDE